MPKLHFSLPEFAATPVDLPEGKTTVGRSSRNRLVLNDVSVSASHCEVLVSWNEVILRDLGSSNGTWVAGIRVNGQHPANHGECIRFGRVEARLELDRFPDDDATAVTANIAASHAARSQASPESFRKVIGSGSSSDDTRNPTISLPASAKPERPTGLPKPQPVLAKPVLADRASSRVWLKLALLLVGVVVVAVFLLMFHDRR